jgi:hypothetical protein
MMAMEGITGIALAGKVGKMKSRAPFEIPILFALVVSFSAVISCSRPASIEKFVRCDDRQEDGSFLFAVDMGDSTLAYDIYFYTEIGKKGDSIIGKIPFTVTFISPSGREYEETAYMRMSDEISSNYCSRQFKALYRKDMEPPENGIWMLSVKVGAVKVPDKKEFSFHYDVPGMKGLGVIVINHKLNVR